MRVLIFFFTVIYSICSWAETGQSPREKAFTDIYSQGSWGRNEEGRGFSGSGSKVETAKPYMKFLEQFIKTHDIKSIVDIGCGDWTFSRYVDFGGAHYIGYDIVNDVIERNQALFSSPTVEFVHGDFLQLDLPQADLLICKDVLQHLSNDEVLSFLSQMQKYPHCLITNDVDGQSLSSNNPTTHAGGYRNIDLTKPPFNVDGSKVLTFKSEMVTKQVLYIQNK